ncbi:hypothetical protein BZA70DRAFT_271273 [Myxozyma melibiosi]|uniref:SWI/SNF and RSC complexes subunit Ssr4 C-terminal domain-containing protein n=1 Tax=Myxozyma melibiosi TaxID=54550 RepID=A0ABR1FC69_9ASCO
MYQHPPPQMPMSPASKRMRMDGPMPPHMPPQGPYAAPPMPPQAVGHPHLPPHMPLPPGAQPGALPLQQPPPPPPPPAVAAPVPAVGVAPGQPGALPASVYAAQHNVLMSLDDEDMFGAVDELDSISARDISTLRYARHHEWMEQILGSAYQSDKIIPPGLFAARGNTTANIWDGIDKLKERVAKMEEDLNSVDEFYTRSIVEIKETKNRAYTQMREAMAKQEAQAAQELAAEGLEEVEEKTSSSVYSSLAIS